VEEQGDSWEWNFDPCSGRDRVQDPDPPSHLPHNLYLSIAPNHGFQARFNLCEERIVFVSPETGSGYSSIHPESKATGVAL